MLNRIRLDSISSRIAAITICIVGMGTAHAHDCAIVVSRDDATPPKLHVNGPSNFLNGEETIDLLPGDAQFVGAWFIDAPGISTMANDGDVRGRLRLRTEHRLALRLVSADSGFCMMEPSTWKPVLCTSGDTYSFVQPEPGQFNIQMVSRLEKPLPCNATFRFVDLAGLHAESAPFTLRFRVDPMIAIGRSFTPAITSARRPGLQIAAYWFLPAVMQVGVSGSAKGGNVRAADGHLHGAPPVWVEPSNFKIGVNLFRAHLHDLDAEILAGQYSAAALRAPVMHRLVIALQPLIEQPGSLVPVASRTVLLASTIRCAAICDAILASARLSDPIALREQQADLAKFLAECDVFLPPEFICPMRCEGEKLYPAEKDCPICGMALADSRAHMDHRPKHGGTFFMAADNKHHLEGVLTDDRRFRVYIYDEFTQPLAADGFTARAELSTPGRDTVQRVILKPNANADFLEVQTPPDLHPISIKLFVDFNNARGEQLFDFRF